MIVVFFVVFLFVIFLVAAAPEFPPNENLEVSLLFLDNLWSTGFDYRVIRELQTYQGHG